MNRKYVTPVLLLSISVWLVVGGARAGLNLFGGRAGPIFQWADAIFTAAFAIVEVVFLPHLAKAIFVARGRDDLRLFFRLLLAATLFIVFALPLLATPVFAAIHAAPDGNFMSLLIQSRLLIPWLFIFFLLLPVSMAAIGLAEMIYSESGGPARSDLQRVLEAMSARRTIDPARLSAETGLGIPEVDRQLAVIHGLFSPNGHG